MKISEASAKTVWKYFSELCNIPRQSGKEQKVTNWLEAIAKEYGFGFKKDNIGNSAITVSPTMGMESLPCVILQCHTDMVCVASSTSKHNFDEDAIEMMETEGWVHANDTTLGADNGIGVAMALAAAIDKTVEHGPLELLFTVDEETGLGGVNNITKGFVTGQTLINLDSEDDGFIIGCAGGRQIDMQLDIEFEKSSDSLNTACIKISGLKGGHSGIHIIDQRANAIILLTRVLNELESEMQIKISSFKGGIAHNAIPNQAEATICFNPNKLEAISDTIQKYQEIFNKEYCKSENQIKINLTETSSASHHLTGKFLTKMLALITSLPHGVHRMSQNFAGVVETSNNIAKASIDAEKNKLCIMCSTRSCEMSQLNFLCKKVDSISKLANCKIIQSNQYPAWEPVQSSKLLRTCADVYKKQFTTDPTIEVIHAGLECGVLGNKLGKMDMISMGPRIQNAHSIKECVEIKSVDTSWNLLKAILKEIK